MRTFGWPTLVRPGSTEDARRSVLQTGDHKAISINAHKSDSLLYKNGAVIGKTLKVDTSTLRNLPNFDSISSFSWSPGCFSIIPSLATVKDVLSRRRRSWMPISPHGRRWMLSIPTSVEAPFSITNDTLKVATRNNLTVAAC